ncbi:YggT family protein [Candidatus Peregrinibacteria bacterium]|nr:MAG: YggT family protein [Candidatus Peregrinibacteria bacterium]
MQMTLAQMLYYLVRILEIAIFARVLFSWIKPPHNALTNLVYNITEPILSPLRRHIPLVGGLDISPIIALVLIDWVYSFLVRMIFF